MLAEQNAEAIRWARRAIALARRIGDVGTEIHALVDIDCARSLGGDIKGFAHLERTMARARALGLEDQTARSFAGLCSYGTEMRLLDRAERWISAGIAFVIEHELDAFHRYFLGWRSALLLHRGQLDRAEEIAQSVLAHAGVMFVDRITPLAVIGRARARRGSGDVWGPL